MCTDVRVTCQPVGKVVYKDMHFWAGVCMVTVHSFQPYTCIYRGVGEVAVIVEGRAYV